MDTAACWGTRDVCHEESDLRFPDSDLLRFRAWSENQKGTEDVTSSVTYSFLVRRVRVSLSGEFDVSKAFTRDLFPLSSSLISSTSHLLRKQRSVWAKAVFTAVCWTPSSQSAVGRSTCMVPAGGVQDASKRLLPGKGAACLFREAADSFDSSLEQPCSLASARKQMCDEPFP